MAANLQAKAYEIGKVLYMAMELSDKKWRLAFGEGSRQRQVNIDSGNVEQLQDQIVKAKEKWNLTADAPVVSCYEAGRDGFWIHRQLERLGIENRVVDAASIEVTRRARRAKTDRLDAQMLLEKLIRYEQGEGKVWSVVRVPPQEWEDLRQLHRERKQLQSECTRHTNRISSKLVAQGVRLKIDAKFPERLEEARLFDGQALPLYLKAGLSHEWERLQLVKEQLKELERRVSELIKTDNALQMVRALMLLTGVGWISAWTLVLELFGWREIANRRQLASLAGLAPSPYNSGQMVRDQGISKAGNARVRALMIQLAWLWLRYQPGSKHSQWYQKRFGGGSSRQRRIGIVALARRLLVDLWRFLSAGVVPEGARVVVS